jgi:hypothetical protein
MLAGCGPLTAAAAPRASELPSAEPSGAASVRPSGVVLAGPSRVASAGRAATAEDYLWFAGVDDLADGFCFTWVRGLTPEQVINATGGQDLERIDWEQLVGSGDGQQTGAEQYFYGVAHVADWSLLIEDNGTFGTTDDRVGPLSRGTTLVSHYRAGDGHGRLLVLEDEAVRLDFDPIEAEKITGRAADAFAPFLDAAGFSYAQRLRSGDQAAYRTYCTAAAFALTERLTGVAMTEKLLETLTYLLTSVPRSLHPGGR